jgi:hypothetical protein
VVPVLATSLLLACQRDEEIPTVAPAEAPSASVVVPVDHLAPGELVEGSERAFELPLPRGMHVDGRFIDVVYASGDVAPDALANYVRNRVRDGKAITGAAGTVFDRVRIPAAPDTYLAIYVRPGPTRPTSSSMLEIRNVTAPKSADMPDEESRWKAAGLKPGGRGSMLDPTHLQ